MKKAAEAACSGRRAALFLGAEVGELVAEFFDAAAEQNRRSFACPCRTGATRWSFPTLNSGSSRPSSILIDLALSVAQDRSRI